MSIDSLSITPNPATTGQGFVISCVVTPEEIPTPSTEYKMPTVAVYSSVGTASVLLDTRTEFGHYVTNTSDTTGAAFILRGFQFPELANKTIVGFQGLVCISNYIITGQKTGSFSFRLVTGLTDGDRTYTNISPSGVAIPFVRSGSMKEYESEVVEDATTLNWLNSHLSDVINGTTAFGIRGYFLYSDVAYFKLKFYYI